MRLTTTLSTAAVCLGVAEGLKFKLHSSFDSPIATARALAKRATINTTFKYAPPQFSYFVDVLVGSAHEFLRLRLSSDPFTWFPGPLPRRNYCNPGTNDNFYVCVQSNFSGTFNPEASDTFTNLTSVLNLTSSNPRFYVTGYYGQDTIQIGQTEINNVPIGIGVDYSRIPQLGLGIGGSGSTQKSLLRVMLEEEIINVLSYGLYLNDYDRNSSELTIGAIDTAKYEGNLLTFGSTDTTTVDLLSVDYEEPGSDVITISQRLTANVEFSTGSLYFPEDVVDKIITSVGGYFDRDYQDWLTSCDYRWSNKVIRFNFDGMTINVPASQWIVPAFTMGGYQTTLRDSDVLACTVLVASMENYGIAADLGYSAVLGMPFVRATYMVHDFTNGQTSFAPAKLNTTDSELKTLGADGVAPFATTPTDTSGPPTPTKTGDDGQETGGGGGGGSSTPTGAIVGGVVGGIAAIAAAIGAIFFFRRRRTPPDTAAPQPPMGEQPPAPPGPYGQSPGAPVAYGGQYNNGYQPQTESTEYYNKGFVPPQSPGPNSALLTPNSYGNTPQSPLSEVGGTPVDQRYSTIAPSVAPSGVSELGGNAAFAQQSPNANPYGANANYARHPSYNNGPVELPGHQ